MWIWTALALQGDLFDMDSREVVRTTAERMRAGLAERRGAARELALQRLFRPDVEDAIREHLKTEADPRVRARLEWALEAWSM
jgi:hypothetical protein